MQLRELKLKRREEEEKHEEETGFIESYLFLSESLSDCY
jgi:hypothetical protein